MKYILHIDTSADNGFVMVSHDGQALSHKNNEDARSYAEALSNDINTVLSDAGITEADLAAITVCGGPGSYTGLRIGLATAKGICYALDKPLMMDNKLTLLALPEYYNSEIKYDKYLAILPARDKEYFISIHDADFNIFLAPQHIDEEQLLLNINELDGKILTIGYIPNALATILSNKNITIAEGQEIDKTSWARYSFDQYNCNNFVTISSSEPFYLKQVYTHKPRKIN